MATYAALMASLAIISMLLPLVVIKHMVKRIMLQRRGEQAAMRSDEVGRFLIICTGAALMVGTVLFLGPSLVAPEMMVSR